MSAKYQHLLVAICIFILLVNGYLFLDARVVLAIHAHNLGQLQQISKYISIIGEPALWGLIALVGLLSVTFTSQRRGRDARLTRREQQIIYVCLTLLLALLLVNLSKFLLGRERPALLFASASYGLDFLTSEWARNSMPSGHTTLIFAAAACFSTLLRRYRLWFFTVAAMVGVCRVLAVQHYLTDVLLGAYLGVISALITKKALLNWFAWPGLMNSK